VFPIGFAQEEIRHAETADSAAVDSTVSPDSLRTHTAVPVVPTAAPGDTLGSGSVDSLASSRPETTAVTVPSGSAATPGDTSKAAADTGTTAQAVAPGAGDSTRVAGDTAAVSPDTTVRPTPRVEVDPARIYEVADLDKEPTVVAKFDPQYPAAARLAGDTCTVVILATVDTTGAVTRVDVRSCTLPGKGFEESAKAAVRRWRYEPGVRAGIKVTFHIEDQIPFRLQ